MAPIFYHKYRSPLVQVDFEVSGRIQGVYFTKYAKDMLDRLDVKGWVMSTRHGTVTGQMQGEKDAVDQMAMWLKLQGSPGSRIEQCVFRNWQIIDGYDYSRARMWC